VYILTDTLNFNLEKRIMKNLKALVRNDVRTQKYFYYLIIVSLLYMVIYLAFNMKRDFAATKSTDTVREEVVNSETVASDFSEEALISFMKKLKIKYPETVLAQAKLETGNFTSAIFKENHNLFGMKVAEKRPTSAIGVNRGHAQYKNWKDSVIDYALLQSYIIAKLPNLSSKEYRSYIQKFYSETSDYLVRMDRMDGAGPYQL
jgi:hypothetical protein